MDIFQSAVRTLGDMVSGFIPKPTPVQQYMPPAVRPVTVSQPSQLMQPQPPYRLGKYGHDLNFEKKEANPVLDNAFLRHELRKQSAEAFGQQSAAQVRQMDAYLRNQQFAKEAQMPLLPVKFS